MSSVAILAINLQSGAGVLKWLFKGIKTLIKGADNHAGTKASEGKLIGGLAQAIARYLHLNPELQTIAQLGLAVLITISAAYCISKYGFPAYHRRVKRLTSYAAIAAITVCISYYCAVDSTIKANPLLRLARQYETSVHIVYFNCGSTYGSYSPIEDRLLICNAAHQGQSMNTSDVDLFRTRESTIRHEIWHRVQACASFRKSGSWGKMQPTGSPALFEHSLPERMIGFINRYSTAERPLEAEAVRAEVLMSDYAIATEFRSHCPAHRTTTRAHTA